MSDTAAACAAAAPAAPAAPDAADSARSHSPPPLAAEGVEDPEAETFREPLREYLATMSEEQALAYKIAHQHLGNSYTIVRSQGFLSWLKKQPQP